MNAVTTTQLYSEYAGMIYRFIVKHANESEAEDLLQTVFIKIDSNLHNFRGDSSVKTWIFTIVRNTLRDHHKCKHSQISGNTFSFDTLADPIHSSLDTLSVEDEIDSVDMKKCIHEYINRLPENDCNILTMNTIKGLSIKEIAATMNVSAGTMKVRLLRARAKLRKILATGCRISFHCNDNLLCEKK